MSLTKQANAQNIFFSCKGLRKYFCPPHQTSHLFYSTYFRMNYLSKPITGFIN